MTPARLLVATLIAFACLQSSVPASAVAPYSTATSLAASTDNPCRGGSLTLTGTGYQPGEQVTITVGGIVIATVTPGSDGTFRIAVTLPSALTGTQELTASGALSNDPASTRIAIAAACSGTGDAGSSRGPGGGSTGGSTGGLSSTGVAVISLLLVGIALVLVGAFLLLGSRRRASA